VFTDRISWRFCFYFNLPIGGITLVSLFFFFRPQNTSGLETSRSFWRKLLELDLMGNGILIATIAILLLVLQWGGTKYPWNSPKVIGLLVGTGLGTVIFVAWQWHRGDAALIPSSILLQRTVGASCLASFFLAGSLLIHSYYLPYYFQAINGDTAIKSGVNVMPYLISTVVLSLLTGAIVSKTGYFTPPAILGPVLSTVGCGLLTMLEVNTPSSKLIGYQVLAAAGIGMAIQQGIIAVQVVLPLESVPIGTAIILFFQNISGSIFVSAGNSILRNELTGMLQKANIPGVNVQVVLAAGATQIRQVVPAEGLQLTLDVYNRALQKVFIVAIPLSALGVFAGLAMEWRSVKEKRKENNESI
jgi:hypothetical protein